MPARILLGGLPGSATVSRHDAPDPRRPTHAGTRPRGGLEVFPTDWAGRAVATTGKVTLSIVFIPSLSWPSMGARPARSSYEF